MSFWELVGLSFWIGLTVVYIFGTIQIARKSNFKGQNLAIIVRVMILALSIGGLVAVLR